MPVSIDLHEKTFVVGVHRMSRPLRDDSELCGKSGPIKNLAPVARLDFRNRRVIKILLWLGSVCGRGGVCYFSFTSGVFVLVITDLRWLVAGEQRVCQEQVPARFIRPRKSCEIESILAPIVRSVNLFEKR